MTADPGSWKAIVFDFDGTLAELNIDFSGMRAGVLARIARHRIAVAGIANLHIIEMIEAAGTILARRSRDEAARFSREAHALITAVEMEAADAGTLFAYTKPLLTELAQRSLRIGIVTRNCRAAVIRTFPDIDRYCRTVLTRDDTERIKPHPEHLMTALNALGTLPADAAMVGDHPLDMQLSREAGTFTIGVLSGHSTREALFEAGAGLILPDASHILNSIPVTPGKHRSEKPFFS